VTGEWHDSRGVTRRPCDDASNRCKGGWLSRSLYGLIVFPTGRALEEIGVDIYMGFMWFEANHYVLQESPMCTYVYLMKVLKSLLTLTCLNQARFKKKSITSKIRYGSAKKGERLARALFISLVKSSFGGRVGGACWGTSALTSFGALVGKSGFRPLAISCRISLRTFLTRLYWERRDLKVGHPSLPWWRGWVFIRSNTRPIKPILGFDPASDSLPERGIVVRSWMECEEER